MSLSVDGARYLLSLLAFITGILGMVLTILSLTCSAKTGTWMKTGNTTFDLCKRCDEITCRPHKENSWISVIRVLIIVALVFACLGPCVHIVYALERSSVLRIYAASLVYLTAGTVNVLGGLGFVIMAERRISETFHFEDSVLFVILAGPVEIFSGLCLVTITQLRRMHLST